MRSRAAFVEAGICAPGHEDLADPPNQVCAISSSIRLLDFGSDAKCGSISVVVPPDMHSAIASQLAPAHHGAPILFTLSECYQLDRVVAVNVARKMHPLQAGPPTVTWNDPAADMLLLSALNGEATFGRPPSQSPSTSTPLYQPFVSPLAPPILYHEPPRSFPAPAPVPVATPLPPTPPRGVIRHSPRHARASSAPPSLPPPMFRGGPRRMHVSRSIIRNRSAPEMSAAQQSVLPPAVLQAQPAYPDCSRDVEMREASAPMGQMICPTNLTIPSLSPQPLLLPRGRQSQGSYAPSFDGLSLPGPRRMGNLYLSSCPGKKGNFISPRLRSKNSVLDEFNTVRLDGPVRGRGAICRDLRSDLRRIRDLGVGCVIWCVRLMSVHRLLSSLRLY